MKELSTPPKTKPRKNTLSDHLNLSGPGFIVVILMLCMTTYFVAELIWVPCT